MSEERKYKASITVPVFGEIPLHPTEIFEDLKLKEGGPLWAQFFKYGVCGMLSTVVLLGVVSLFYFYMPEYLSEGLSASERNRNLTIVHFVAFVPANLFAYFTNRWLVFTPGKFGFWSEMGIFTLISALSFAGGEVGKTYIVNMGYSNWLATGAFAVSSALVNFVARKFIVFSR